MISNNKFGGALLITGGTGYFLHEDLNRFLKNHMFDEIRIFSRDEKKQDEMRNEYVDNRIKYYIGDVIDAGSFKNSISDVDYVFHAAALKHVPSCEFFPLEATRINIIGTHDVLNDACMYSVKNDLFKHT